MGSMNFGLFAMLNRFKDFKHEWERDYLENTRDLIFRNTFKDIEYILTHLRGERHALRVRVLRHRAPLQPRRISSTAAWCEPPLFVQTVFGLLGGIGAHPEDVLHMKRTADRLFGDSLPLVGAGRRPQPDADRRAWPRRWAATCGSGSRIRLWIGPGRLAESNAEQVAPGAADHRGPGPRGRDPGRRARASWT